MQFSNFIFFLWFCLVSTVCHASVSVIAFDQFHNIQMQPNDTIITNYIFGTNAIIFCFDNTLQNFGTITWPFLTIPQISHLPIFLKTKKEFQGEFADPFGTIYITNTSSILRVVSCEFGF